MADTYCRKSPHNPPVARLLARYRQITDFDTVISSFRLIVYEKQNDINSTVGKFTLEYYRPEPLALKDENLSAIPA